MATPINHDNPIKVYPDGSMWCALVGDDLQSGYTAFARTPDLAVKKLYESDEIAEYLPHAVYEMQCSECNHEAVYVVLFPYAFDTISCSKCGHHMPIEQDVV